MGYLEILRTVGPVAGIGGIAIASATWIFRAVIARDIFPMLTKEDAYRIIRLVVLCAFMLGVLGIAAWVAPQIISASSGPIIKTQPDYSPLPAPTRSDPGPETSKLSFTETWIDNPPTKDAPGLIVKIPKGWKQDEADAALISYNSIGGEAEDRFILYYEPIETDFNDFVAMMSTGSGPNSTGLNWSKLRAQFAQWDGEKLLETSRLPVQNSKGDRTIVGDYEVFSTIKSPDADNDRYFLSRFIFDGANRDNVNAKVMPTINYIKLSCQVPASMYKQRKEDCERFFRSIILYQNSSEDMRPGTVD